MNAPPLKIRTLSLKRFRSVPAEHIVFANPLFLVGKNGSGKSNVVDALGFLADCMVQPLRAALNVRGGISAVRYRPGPKSYPGNFGLRVEFEGAGARFAGWYAFELKALPEYGYEVLREECAFREADEWHTFERTPGSFTSSVAKLAPAMKKEALALPLIAGGVEFAPVWEFLSAMRVYAIEPSKVRDPQDPDTGETLRRDGANIASVLRNLAKPELDRLCEILATIVPGTRDVQPVQHGKKLSLEFRQDWAGGQKVRFEAFAMSDGTLRALGILTAILQKPLPAVLAIEEPEATLHPEALGAILDMIQLAAGQMQVVITTHSPELLDAKWITADHLRVVTWEAGVTRVLPLGDGSVEALRRHLMGAGEMFRSNALLPRDAAAEPRDASALELFGGMKLPPLKLAP